MDRISGADDFENPEVAPRADCRILRRILAVILLCGALLFGGAEAIIIIGTVGGGMQGRLGPAWIIFFVGGIAWVCAWLARLLWSGRAIPTWFIGTCLYAPAVGVGIASLTKGDWSDAAGSAVVLLTVYWQTRSFFSGSKPKMIPEL